MNLSLKLILLALIPILFPFVVGLVNYKKLNTFKWLFYYVTFGVINETLSVILIKSGSQNTMPKGHFYIFVSFVLMCIFYRGIFKNYIDKKWFLAVILAFTLFNAINLLFIQTIYQYPVWPHSISIFIFIVFSVLHFYRVMVEAKIRNLWKEPMIWINTGVLFYFSGALFYTVLFNVILEYSIEFSKLVSIYLASLNAIYYILIGIGFLKVNSN